MRVATGDEDGRRGRPTEAGTGEMKEREEAAQPRGALMASNLWADEKGIAQVARDRPSGSADAPAPNVSFLIFFHQLL